MEPLKKSNPIRIMARFAKLAATHPWLLFISIAGSGSVQILGVIQPLYLKNLVNILAGPTRTGSVAGQAFHILSIIAILYVLQWASRRVMALGMVHLEADVMFDMNERSFAYLMRHSSSFFSNQFSGTLTRRVNKYAQAFETVADSVIMTLFPAFVFVLGSVIVLSSRNLVIGCVFFAWCAVFVSLQVALSIWRQPYREARSESDSRATGALADAITNQTAITFFSGVAYETNRFAEFLSDVRLKTLRSWTADEYLWGIQGLLMIFIEVALFYGAIHYWQQGNLTVGDFILIEVYVIGTIDFLVYITQQLRRLYDAFADAAEMIAILDDSHEIQDQAGASSIRVTDGDVVFHNVSFFFHSTKPLLDHFNLAINGGEKIALVGLSGAGKSTVTKLLLRLYDVKSGSIMIDGQNIAEVTQESLRNTIAFVPQEPILFHRTLMENIRYGRRDASDAEVIEAAKQAYCHDFISALPEGYETLVGERGVKLSGGERQRVAVARAILKNAPILVLDEATSSLDSESEAMIQKALDNLMQGKTVLAIAHRLSTIMRMDRILVMENGAIVDSGTHDELLGRDGLYQKLWSIQAGGFLQDEEK